MGFSQPDGYGGAQWDPAAPPPRRSSSPLLIAGIGMLVVTLLVGGYFTLTSASFQDLFAGSAPQPTPTRNPSPTVVVAAAPTAPPSGQASQPSPSSTPVSPGPGGQGDKVDAFTTFMKSNASYVADISGVVKAGNEVVHVTMTYRASGQDYDGTFVMTYGHVRVRGETVRKDGIVYARLGKGQWQREEAPDSATTNMFGEVEPDDWRGLENLGTERRKGEKVEHLRLPKNVDWSHLMPSTTSTDGVSVSLNKVAVDIWVAHSGEPREAQFSVDGTTEKDGVELDVSFRLNYRFSHVGTPVEITAPVTDATDS